jgi:hypothetical protein
MSAMERGMLSALADVELQLLLTLLSRVSASHQQV